MVYTDLDRARDLAVAKLQSAQDGLGAGGDKEARSLFSIAWNQRMLGIWHLLAHLDVDAFRTCLERSGHAQLHLLKRQKAGLSASGRYVAGSDAVGFVAALASGDMTLSQAVAAELPGTHDPEQEYEDDFLRIRFLERALLSAGDAELQSILDRWEAVCEGNLSACGHVAAAAVSRAQAAWLPALEAYLAARAQALDEHRMSVAAQPELLATEGKIFLDALAYVQIGRLRGLAVDQDLPMCPRVAQLQPRPGSPAGAAWKEILDR